MRNRTGYDLAEHWVVNHMGRNSPRKCIFVGITKNSSLILQKNGNALKQVFRRSRKEPQARGGADLTQGKESESGFLWGAFAAAITQCQTVFSSVRLTRELYHSACKDDAEVCSTRGLPARVEPKKLLKE